MKMISRKTLLACALSLAALAGSAAAAWAQWGYNYSIEYYDGNGNIVGQEGYDCNIGSYRWGDTTLNSTYWDYGPCP